VVTTAGDLLLSIPSWATTTVPATEMRWRVMTDSQGVVREFLESLGRMEDVAAAITSRCTEDCTWENSGFPAAEGKTAMLAMIEGFGASGIAEIESVTTALVADGPVVLTERTEHFKGADGQTLASMPIMGAFEVRDGLIAAWRDYFDPSALQQPGS